MLNLPISYICLKMGGIPQCVVIVAIVCEIVCLTARIKLLKDMIGLDISAYIHEVILNLVLVTIVSVPIPVVIAYHVDNSLLRLIFSTIASVICAGVSILYIGCARDERQMIYSKIRQIADKKILHRC